jgi:FkbM family methyltransferase
MIIAGLLSQMGYRPRGIVHVGAHYAQEMAEYLRLSPMVIAWIEADAGRCEQIRRIIRLAGDDATRQVVIEGLVADTDGEDLQFWEFTNQGASSSIFPSTQILRDAFPGVQETGEVKTLPTARLDTLLPIHGVSAAMVDVLIFDIQGAELLGLKGAGAFLKQARFVEVELSVQPIYEGAPLAPEVDAYLVEQGFERMTEIPWHGDAVYRRV